MSHYVIDLSSSISVKRKRDLILHQKSKLRSYKKQKSTDVNTNYLDAIRSGVLEDVILAASNVDLGLNHCIHWRGFEIACEYSHANIINYFFRVCFASKNNIYLSTVVVSTICHACYQKNLSMLVSLLNRSEVTSLLASTSLVDAFKGLFYKFNSRMKQVPDMVVLLLPYMHVKDINLVLGEFTSSFRSNLRFENNPIILSMYHSKQTNGLLLNTRIIQLFLEAGADCLPYNLHFNLYKKQDLQIKSLQIALLENGISREKLSPIPNIQETTFTELDNANAFYFSILKEIFISDLARICYFYLML